MAFKMKGSHYYGKNPLKQKGNSYPGETRSIEVYGGDAHEDNFAFDTYDHDMRKAKYLEEQKKYLKEKGWDKDSKSSPNKQKNQVKIVGEDTGEIKKDKNNQTYVIQEYDTQSGLMRGDTIQLVGDSPRVGDYLMGGDYYGKETEESKKRKSGPKTYKIRNEE